MTRRRSSGARSFLKRKSSSSLTLLLLQWKIWMFWLLLFCVCSHTLSRTERKEFWLPNPALTQSACSFCLLSSPTHTISDLFTHFTGMERRFCIVVGTNFGGRGTKRSSKELCLDLSYSSRNFSDTLIVPAASTVEVLQQLLFEFPSPPSEHLHWCLLVCVFMFMCTDRSRDMITWATSSSIPFQPLHVKMWVPHRGV